MVSIARFNKFWKGFEYKKLAPPADIIKIEDEELYTRLYNKRVLNKLNPQEMYNELGENSVLLCYEKWTDIKNNKTFCDLIFSVRVFGKNWVSEIICRLISRSSFFYFYSLLNYYYGYVILSLYI